MPIFFATQLECVATFWRIYRRDGVALAFTSHDRALNFDGFRHRAAPGMLPTAIRRSDDFDSDNAEVNGALSHDSISEKDLAAGLYDHAHITIGAVNWETFENEVFYSGSIGQVEDDGFAFSTELISPKAQLDAELVPQTSPTCRAVFCGPACGLSEPRFSARYEITEIDFEANAVLLDVPNPVNFADGKLRFLDGPQTGVSFGILAAQNQRLTLDRPLYDYGEPAQFVELLEGCDHTIETCGARFKNAANFRGEPFLPGNDLLARYPTGR